jgi:hypothetical protein
MKIVASHISGLYAALPVYLWVEDEDTRTYFSTVWGADVIGTLVAGGLGNVRAAVQSARHDGLTHVFGFCDRDFGASNLGNWTTTEVFVGDAFEVESYLLDARAIADCSVNSAGRTEADVEAEMFRHAQGLAWWMSCRRTIASVRDVVAADFVEHPARASVRDLEDGVDAIVKSGWWTNTLPQVPSLDVAFVRKQLQTDYASYAAMLQNGTWRQGFSAKEIFVEPLPWVYTKKRPPDPEGRLDFVKAIAERQRATATVPDEVVALGVELRRRVGR